MICFSRPSHTIAYFAMLLLFMSLIGPTYATKSDHSPSIQQPLAAHLSRADISDIRTAAVYPEAHAYPVTTPVNYGIMMTVWDAVAHLLLKFRIHAIKLALWSLCISLMVMSCVIEQNTSPMRLWLALCLSFSWIVPISLYLHKVIRKFQTRGRVDSYIVTTAMLSFVFIKAFAILGGYNAVALLRVPSCFTAAAWIASHWCNFDATPEIRFGA